MTFRIPRPRTGHVVASSRFRASPVRPPAAMGGFRRGPRRGPPSRERRVRDPTARRSCRATRRASRVRPRARDAMESDATTRSRGGGFRPRRPPPSRDGAGKPCRASTPGSRPRARTLGSRCPSEHARRIHRDDDASRVAIDARRVRLVVPGAVVQRADSTAAFRVFSTTWPTAVPQIFSLADHVHPLLPTTN